MPTAALKESKLASLNHGNLCQVPKQRDYEQKSLIESWRYRLAEMLLVAPCWAGLGGRKNPVARDTAEHAGNRRGFILGSRGLGLPFHKYISLPCSLLYNKAVVEDER